MVNVLLIGYSWHNGADLRVVTEPQSSKSFINSKERALPCCLASVLILQLHSTYCLKAFVLHLKVGVSSRRV